MLVTPSGREHLFALRRGKPVVGVLHIVVPDDGRHDCSLGRGSAHLRRDSARSVLPREQAQQPWTRRRLDHQAFICPSRRWGSELNGVDVSAEDAVQVTRCPHHREETSNLDRASARSSRRHSRSDPRPAASHTGCGSSARSHEPIQRRRPDDCRSAAADHLPGLSASHARKGPALAGALSAVVFGCGATYRRVPLLTTQSVVKMWSRSLVGASETVSRASDLGFYACPR
jgi:hypothetical protein